MIMGLLLQLVLYIGLLFAEKIVGVPMLAMLYGLTWSTRLQLPWRYLWLTVLWWLVSVVFAVPFAIIWFVLGASYLWILHGRQFIASQLLRVLVGGFFCAAVVLIWTNTVSMLTVLYVGVAVGVYVVSMKLPRFRMARGGR